MRQKLNLIKLGVKDFEKSLQFYKNLGWKKSDKSMEEMAFFMLNGIILGLHPIHELEKDTGLKYRQSDFSGLTISFNAKSKLEVDEIIKEIDEIGGEIIREPQDVYWGGYNAYFKDLDGYLFEVAYNPLWSFDENDNIIL